MTEEKKKRGRPRKNLSQPAPLEISELKDKSKIERTPGGVMKKIEINGRILRSLRDDPRYNFEPGDNSKNIGFLLKIADLPKIDLYQPEQVKERTMLYFRMCEEADMKPLVSSYAASIGLSRRELYEIRTGKFNNFWHKHFDRLPAESIAVIRSAHDFLEQLWETNMVQGKVNPVTGIFLGKNNFGYQDSVDYTITPGKQETNADEIIKRYAEEHDIPAAIDNNSDDDVE